jgi:hypothetical protein
MTGSAYDWIKNSGLKTSGQNSISSGYGIRNANQTSQGYSSTNHKGVDVRFNVGTNITTNETLTYVGGSSNPNAASGYSATFVDSQGYKHTFMHLNSPPGYTNGQVVSPGQVVGVTGNSGNSSGPHLDYRVTDSNGNPVDPLSTDSGGVAHMSKFGPEGSEEGLGGMKRSSVPPDTAGSPAGDGPGTQSAAAGAGGAGGGAGCVGAMMNPMNLMAMAGVLQGLGLSSLGGIMGNLTGALSAVPGVSALASAATSITGALSGAVGGVLQGALGGITGMVSGVANNLLGSVSQIGANLIPGLGNVISGTLASGLNQLVSPLTSVLQNPLNIVGVAQQFSSKGGLSGFLQNVAGNMAGNFVAGATSAFSSSITNAIGGTMNNLLGNISMASGMSGISRDIVGGISEAMGQTFGNGTGGLGALFKNMEGIATFGVGTLANNIGMVAADMVSAGTWDTRNLTRLMQPGNIAAQIIDRGLGEATGLIPAIIRQNIPLAGIDSPMYDSQIRGILSNINSDAAVSAVAKEFGVGVNLNNLGQLTDIKHMMPDSASKMPIKDFAELGLMLTEMQVTQAPDLSYIGDAFLKIETTRDLNHISQLPKPIHQPSGELVMKAFGYGSGTFGEISMADVLGTVAGYVHEDTVPVIVENTNWLKTQAVAAKYFNGTSFLEELIAGKYTVEDTESVETSPGSGIYNTVTSYIITVPTGRSGDTGVANGDIGTFTDSGDGQQLLAAVEAVKDYIEEGMQDLLDSNDPDIKAAVQAIDLAHNASIAQVVREAHLLKMYNIDLFREAPMTPLDAYVFGMSLDGYARQTGYGHASEFLERLATDDLYGDAIKFSMRQARNAEILAPLGVNVERFQVPNSQYYRNPLGMIESLYNGRMPSTPIYQQSINYPTDPTDQYIIQRDSTLVEAGMDLDDMLPAEKDELYYDTYWQNANEFIRRGMGESAMYAAISRNLKILGNRVEIIDLDGNRRRVADLTAKGLENLDTGLLITILFDLVNRVLYGNIGVTKNTNPFYTDELVYAVVEAMGAVNPGSIDFLMQSSIGQTVLSDFLVIIANRFKNINTVFDTRMDRNDPGAYGGAGPGYDPRTARGDLDNQI